MHFAPTTISQDSMKVKIVLNACINKESFCEYNPLSV